MGVEFLLTKLDVTNQTLDFVAADGTVKHQPTGIINLKGEVQGTVSTNDEPELQKIIENQKRLVPKNAYINDENTALALRGLLEELMRIRTLLSDKFKEPLIPLASDKLEFVATPISIDKFLLTLSQDTHKILTMLQREKVS